MNAIKTGNAPSFTRDQWLDGIIWGVGARQTRKSVSIRVSELPLTIIERINERLEEHGYETQEREIPNAVTHQIDYSLLAIGSEPVFDGLPEYSVRRISLEYPEEFIDGFLLTRLSARRKRRVDGTNFSLDDVDILIRSGQDTPEIKNVLGRKNIEFSQTYRSFLIKPSSHSIAPISTFLTGLADELENFREDIEDEDSILQEIQEGVEEKIRRRDSRLIPLGPRRDDPSSIFGAEPEEGSVEGEDNVPPAITDHETNDVLESESIESIVTNGDEKMQLHIRSHSYRFSEEILNSKIHLKKEIEKSLLDISPDLYKLTRPTINDLIDATLAKTGWVPQAKLFDDDNEGMMRIDYLKDRVQLEVETGHPSFLGIDLLKFQLASQSCHDKADVGIYVVTTESFQRTMIEKYHLAWEGSITFEKVVRSLPSFKAAIQVPIYVIGLDI